MKMHAKIPMLSKKDMMYAAGGGVIGAVAGIAVSKVMDAMSDQGRETNSLDIDAEAIMHEDEDPDSEGNGFVPPVNPMYDEDLNVDR